MSDFERVLRMNSTTFNSREVTTDRIVEKEKKEKNMKRKINFQVPPGLLTSVMHWAVVPPGETERQKKQRIWGGQWIFCAVGNPGGQG